MRIAGQDQILVTVAFENLFNTVCSRGLCVQHALIVQSAVLRLDFYCKICYFRNTVFMPLTAAFNAPLDKEESYYKHTLNTHMH